MHFRLFAACALAGAAVCADAVSDSFESGTVGSADPNWGTAGVVSSDVKANLAAADSPLNLATTKSLAVTGTVQRTASLTPDSSNGVKVDMLVKLTAPDDALTPKAGYVNTIVTTASAGTAPEPVEITSGATTVTVPVPAVNGDSAVKYTYQIKTVTK